MYELSAEVMQSWREIEKCTCGEIASSSSRSLLRVVTSIVSPSN